jgi:hypothetical protein
VTAEDVKWSLDRVVTAPVLGTAQLTGSMTPTSLGYRSILIHRGDAAETGQACLA